MKRGSVRERKRKRARKKTLTCSCSPNAGNNISCRANHNFNIHNVYFSLCIHNCFLSHQPLIYFQQQKLQKIKQLDFIKKKTTHRERDMFMSMNCEYDVRDSHYKTLDEKHWERCYSCVCTFFLRCEKCFVFKSNFSFDCMTTQSILHLIRRCATEFDQFCKIK